MLLLRIFIAMVAIVFLPFILVGILTRVAWGAIGIGWLVAEEISEEISDRISD